MGSNPQFPVDLVTFTEKNLDTKLHFLRSEYIQNSKEMKFQVTYQKT